LCCAQKYEAQTEFVTTKEGECAKEGCTCREKGHYSNTSRTRSGEHHNTRIPLTIHPTGNRATQVANHTHKGSCKNSKVHNQLPEYMITEDDANLVEEKV
jgi:hypothetical protein